ncbi:MAG: hypothetical protein AAFO75_06245 [Pseudomonadota bacterium]
MKTKKSVQTAAKKTAAKAGARSKSSSRVSKSPAQPDLTTAIARLEAELLELSAERDALRDELEVAQNRVKALEEAQTQAINRIDWVIDSLHNVIEPKA